MCICFTSLSVAKKKYIYMIILETLPNTLSELYFLILTFSDLCCFKGK